MCQFLKGLNNKTKLTIYKTFGGEVKFKRYLNGVGDAGTRLLFKLRSGTHISQGEKLNFLLVDWWCIGVV